MRTERRPPARRWPGAVLGSALLAWAGPGHGLVDARPFGSLSYEHDDNVFRFADEAEAVEQRGSATLGDTLSKLTAGAWLDADIGRQKLRALGAFHQYRYGEFEELDRSEGEAEARFEWAAGIPWTGHAVYERSRTLEPLSGRDSVDIGHQHRQEVELFAGYAVTPSWQVQLGAGERRKRLTRDVARAADFDETRGRLGLAYGSALGIAGVAVELARGDFPGREPTPGLDTGYERRDFLLHARNDHSGISTFETEFGYTARSSPSGADSFRGPTGRLRHEWRWFSKTAIEGQFARRLRDSEDPAANYVSELASALVVRHTFTSFISAVAKVHGAVQDFRGSTGTDDPDAEGREDRVVGLEAGVVYAPRPWISLKPRVGQERRSSTRAGRQYDATTIGLTLEVRAD
jgi:hypothetical protein